MEDLGAEDQRVVLVEEDPSVDQVVEDQKEVLAQGLGKRMETRLLFQGEAGDQKKARNWKAVQEEGGQREVLAEEDQTEGGQREGLGEEDQKVVLEGVGQRGVPEEEGQKVGQVVEDQLEVPVVEDQRVVLEGVTQTGVREVAFRKVALGEACPKEVREVAFRKEDPGEACQKEVHEARQVKRMER